MNVLLWLLLFVFAGGVIVSLFFPANSTGEVWACRVGLFALGIACIVSKVSERLKQ
jgi:hypothetical protein